MSDTIYATLQGLLQQEDGNKVLRLAQDQFAGPIQAALSQYLSGLTLQLGPDATLQVDPATRQLSLKAKLENATLALQATTNGATLTLASAQYAGAQVVLDFEQTADGVQLTLSANMGDELQWPLQSLWPQQLNWQPANRMSFARGQMSLRYVAQSLTFDGQGSLLYDSQRFVNAALRVQYVKSKTGVMFGVVAAQWSPGSIWPPLSALVFDNSGVVVSTLDGKSGSLESLGLLSAKQVPAIAADFDIAPGFLLFTSLQLSDKLKAIANFMGNVTQLDLFASYASSSGATSLKAVLNNRFSAQANGIFEFDGFELDWENPSNGNSTISAKAKGKFHPDAKSAIDLSLQGSIVPSEGDLNLTIGLQNWVQPFGLETVTIVDLQAGVTIGAAAAGVTLVAGGDLKLQNPKSTQFEFEVGFAVEVVDFEVPNGIALWTQADQQPMTVSNVLDAAFALDVSPAALRQQGEPEVAEVVGFLNELVSVKQFTFWFVEGAQIQKIGDHGPFPAGFGVQAAFTLLGQEDVSLSALLAESGNAKAGFSGYILLSRAVEWGSVFKLSGWDPASKKPTDKGPQLAIAATPAGIVVPGVNNDQPLRFFSSLYLKFIDLVEDHLYALATTDNQFQLDYAVQNGQPAGGCGVWSGDHITFLLDPQNDKLAASFGFNFGWKDLQWGGISLWGVTLVPKLSLPDFSIAAGLGFAASLTSLTVNGHFNFSLLGLNLNLGSADHPYTLLNVNVQGVIDSLGDVATQLLEQVKQEASKLIQAMLSDVSAFLAWAKNQWRNLVNGLQLIGQILKDHFGVLGQALAEALKGLGALAAEVQQVLVALGYLLEEAAKWVGDLFGCPITKASNQL
ncbi:hypothetical protein [Paludibacterium purpuratum]|uniref:Uncharacterized protein n=1 Tax=Paludibacterium purpuratum TaxID=1144873 RepID=A0A4R7BBA6_9NEIS|nr:hypothetical protein [Paludibacterium purpuratum]TDR81923.1 hypothetical protein DFP86_10233 [Paludibacterium purpuratum]